MVKNIKKIPISKSIKNRIFLALTKARFIQPLRVYQSSAGFRVPATVNLRAVFSDPKSLKLIAQQFKSIVKNKKIEYVAGYEISGVPLATAISLACNIKSFALRKVRHDHGMFSCVAGYIPPKGVRIAVADDGLASGKSMIRSVRNLKQEGYKNIHEYLYLLITEAAHFSKNIAWLKKNNITIYYLVDYKEYIEWAVENKYLSPIAGWAALDGMTNQPSWVSDKSKWQKFNKAKKKGEVWSRY